MPCKSIALRPREQAHVGKPKCSACMHRLMQLCMDRQGMHRHTDRAHTGTYKLATHNQVHATQMRGGGGHSSPASPERFTPAVLIRLASPPLDLKVNSGKPGCLFPIVSFLFLIFFVPVGVGVA